MRRALFLVGPFERPVRRNGNRWRERGPFETGPPHDPHPHQRHDSPPSGDVPRSRIVTALPCRMHGMDQGSGRSPHQERPLPRLLGRAPTNLTTVKRVLPAAPPILHHHLPSPIYQADYAPPARPGSAHAYRSSSSAHPNGQATPAPSEYHSHPPTDGLRNYGETYGTPPAS